MNLTGNPRMLLSVVMGIMFLPDGRFLIARRPAHKMYGGLWEFPGGKINPDETAEQALCREFREELDIAITIDTPLDEYEYHQGETTIRFLPCIGRLEGSRVRLLEHEQAAYISVAELDNYQFAPPDYEILTRLKAGAGYKTAEITKIQP